MSASIGQLLVALGIDPKGMAAGPVAMSKFERTTRSSMGSASRAMEDTERHTGKLGRAMHGLGGIATVAGGILAAVGTARIFDFGKEMFNAVGAESKLDAQTRAVLKSTGGAAHVTAAQISELATSLSEMSAVQDETIKNGENLLLTFTNIQNRTGKGNDIFNQATKAMLNMSVALGQDTKSSAIQLGKALNDPIKGVTALQRVGVSFTADQKKQIAELVKSGRTMQAQKLILRELNKEFGGSAAAQATPMAKIHLAIEEAGKSLMKIFAPAITSVLKVLPGLINGITKWIDGNKTLIGQIRDKIAAGIGLFVAGIKALIDIWTGLPDIAKWAAGVAIGVWLINKAFMANPIVAIIMLIVGAVGLLAGVWKESGGTFDKFVSLLGTKITGVVTGIVKTVQKWLPIVVRQIGEWAKAFVAWIGPMIPKLLAFLGQMLGKLVAWIGRVAPQVLATLGQWARDFIAWVGPMIPPLLARLGQLIGRLLGWIGREAPKLVNKLAEWGGAFIAWVGPQIPPLLKKLGDLLGDVGKWIVNTGLPILAKQLLVWGTAIVSWIGDAAPKAITAFGDWMQQVVAWIFNTGLPALGAAALGLGKAIVDGIGDKLAGRKGQTGLVSDLMDFVTNTLVPAFVNVGIAVFQAAVGVGGQIVSGIINGLVGLPGALMKAIGDAVGSISIDLGPIHLGGSNNNGTISGTVSGVLVTGGGGTFANGGMAPAGVASLFGERGPEIGIPQTPTLIIPHGLTQKLAAMAGGGGRSVTINSPVTVQGLVRARSANDIGMQARRHLELGLIGRGLSFGGEF